MFDTDSNDQNQEIGNRRNALKKHELSQAPGLLGDGRLGPITLGSRMLRNGFSKRGVGTDVIPRGSFQRLLDDVVPLSS
jgi:hypothetical protein